MSEPIPAVLRRDAKVTRKARPLIEDSRIVKCRVVEQLGEIDDELTELHRRARRIVEEARESAEEIRRQARARGRREAMNECMKNLAKARDEYAELKKCAERDMVTLAFQIARQIIGRTIELDAEVITEIVGQALVNARGREQIVVQVHPDDYDRVQSVRHRYVRSLDGVPVYFESNAELQPGDCFIETESGCIDARLETQLDVMRQELLDDELSE